MVTITCWHGSVTLSVLLPYGYSYAVMVRLTAKQSVFWVEILTDGHNVLL